MQVVSVWFWRKWAWLSQTEVVDWSSSRGSSRLVVCSSRLQCRMVFWCVFVGVVVFGVLVCSGMACVHFGGGLWLWFHHREIRTDPV